MVGFRWNGSLRGRQLKEMRLLREQGLRLDRKRQLETLNVRYGKGSSMIEPASLECVA
jgi:hypothetical protein